MKRKQLWMMAMAAISLLGGCTIFESEEPIVTGGDSPSVAVSSDIAPSYFAPGGGLPALASGRMPSTRSAVDQTSVVDLTANFLRIDEDINPDTYRGYYTFSGGEFNPARLINWEKGYVVEGTLMSAPDDSEEHLRSAYLAPVQSYRLRVESREVNGEQVKDTTDFYHTRMVTWHPQNLILDRTAQNTPAITQLDNDKFKELYEVSSFDATGDGYNEENISICFTGLDGQTDVMVSDMLEGQHWHYYNSLDPHVSDRVPEGHPYLTPGENIYSEPFGHFYQPAIEGVQQEVNYRNYFTYRHYLTAIRVFAYAEQSEQNLNMWGEINNVTIANQPTSVKVALPTSPGTWGEAHSWGDRKVIEIVKTPFYGEDDVSGMLPESVEYPISTRHSSEAQQTYLGYALVEPNSDVLLQIHTTSAVYQVRLRPEHFTTDAEGNQQVVNIFKEGFIYNIHLNLKTDGTIAAILENESDELYYDLTRLATYELPDSKGEGGEGSSGSIAVYRHANCYIVSPQHTFVKDEEGNDILDAQGNKRVYDGYCFSATTIGNGQGGIISSGAQTMYPTSARISPHNAHLLWESELGLISQVELLYGYVRFKVPDKTKEGNAVIAVYDKNGVVVWSWHIWITDPPQEQVFERSNGTTITLLDRNLGATAAKWTTGDPSTALPTYGLYYQWGRKDPSMGPLTYNYFPTTLITQPYYDYSSHEHRAAEVVQLPRPTLQDGVEYPMYLMLPSEQTQTYYYNWSYELYDFLWGYDAQKGTMVKTIYDPCPFGYRVPFTEMSTIFAEDGQSTFQTPNNNEYGQIFTDKNGDSYYFPYAGFKGVDVGLQSLVLAWRYVGEKGDYMSSWVNKTTGGKYNHRARVYISRSREWTETNVGTYSAYRHDDFTNRRTAGSIRCVKNDKPLGLLDIRLVPSQTSVQENDRIVLHCSAESVESTIDHVRVKVRNLKTGKETILYETKNGEGGQSAWSKDVEFFTGDASGENYSEMGYTFELYCINSAGAAMTVHANVAYHSLNVDLSKWESAEASESPLPEQEFARVVHVQSSETPSKVEVIYKDSDGVERTYDITSTAYDSTLPSGGYISNLAYYHPFKFTKSGTYPVTIRVTCGHPNHATDAKHIKTVETQVVVYDYLEIQLINKSGRYVWMADDVVVDDDPDGAPAVPVIDGHTEVEFEYRAKSINAPITSQSILYNDGYAVSYGADAPLNPNREDRKVSTGIVDVPLPNTSTLDYSLQYSATDSTGVSRAATAKVGIIGLDKSEWNKIGVVGQPSALVLRLYGGGTPELVQLYNAKDNVRFNLEMAYDSSEGAPYIHDAVWFATHTYQYVGEQHFDLIVKLRDENNEVVELPHKEFVLNIFNDISLDFYMKYGDEKLTAPHKRFWRSEVREWIDPITPITIYYNALTNNEGAAMKSVDFYLDGVKIDDYSFADNTSQNASKDKIDITDYVIEEAASGDGRLSVEVHAVDGVGVYKDAEGYVALFDVEFEEGWSAETPAGRDFTRTLLIKGGDIPTSLTVGGVAFEKDTERGVQAADPYVTSSWSGTFHLPEGSYSQMPVVLGFGDAETLTYNYAPTLNVTKKIEPIEASISLSHNEIFFGAKNTNATLNVAASSPNGNLTSVSVTTSDGEVIFSGNPASPQWNNDALAYNPTSGGENKVFTITATDEYGITATATATATVYRVTKMESFSNLDTSSSYLLENTEYTDPDRYVYDNNGSLATSTSLSEAQFITLAGSGTSYSLRFSTNRYLNLANNSATLANSSMNIQFGDKGTSCSLYVQSSSWWNPRTYYFKQTDTNKFTASVNERDDYTWYLYKVTTN